MATKYLIAGLGNIGAEYEGTRHNIGFEVVDSLVREMEGQFAIGRLAAVAEVKWKGHVLVCIKPNTYMNLSGQAVKYLMDKERIAIDHVLVILDDLALPLSKLRLKGSGSAGGHNGLKSIEATLGTQQYPRLRLGVGSNFARGKQVGFVLGRWEPQELAVVRTKVEKSVELIKSFVSIGIDRTMNLYNNLEFEL